MTLNTKKHKYAWECNECGSQEYTMHITEDDVHNLRCSKCGGDEWHESTLIDNITKTTKKDSK